MLAYTANRYNVYKQYNPQLIHPELKVNMHQHIILNPQKQKQVINKVCDNALSRTFRVHPLTPYNHRLIQLIFDLIPRYTYIIFLLQYIQVGQS